MRGRSRGECVLSASMVTTTSSAPAPCRTTRRPVSIALASPRLRSCTMSCRGRRPAWSLTTDEVASLLPSSTTTTVYARSPVARMDAMPSSSGGRFSASLKAGRTTQTLAAVGPTVALPELCAKDVGITDISSLSSPPPRRPQSAGPYHPHPGGCPGDGRHLCRGDASPQEEPAPGGQMRHPQHRIRAEVCPRLGSLEVIFKRDPYIGRDVQDEFICRRPGHHESGGSPPVVKWLILVDGA